jgi:hypothetical protein
MFTSGTRGAYRSILDDVPAAALVRDPFGITTDMAAISKTVIKIVTLERRLFGRLIYSLSSYVEFHNQRFSSRGWCSFAFALTSKVACRQNAERVAG